MRFMRAIQNRSRITESSVCLRTNSRSERVTVTESNSSHAPQKSGNLRVKQTKIDHSLTALVKARNAL